jgi:hypothetical protein
MAYASRSLTHKFFRFISFSICQFSLFLSLSLARSFSSGAYFFIIAFAYIYRKSGVQFNKTLTLLMKGKSYGLNYLANSYSCRNFTLLYLLMSFDHPLSSKLFFESVYVWESKMNLIKFLLRKNVMIIDFLLELARGKRSKIELIFIKLDF